MICKITGGRNYGKEEEIEFYPTSITFEECQKYIKEIALKDLQGNCEINHFDDDDVVELRKYNENIDFFSVPGWYREKKELFVSDEQLEENDLTYRDDDVTMWFFTFIDKD